MKVLVDEDACSATPITRLKTAGYEVIQLPTGTSDEELFAEAQRLRVPILTANVGRKGRQDPRGVYRLAAQEQTQPGTASRTGNLTRLNDFLQSPDTA
jgi:hypothetical protein